MAVFMTNAIGLWDWQRVGNLSREVEIYRKLAEDGWRISFYTYDRRRVLPEIDLQANIVTQWPFVLPKRFSFLYEAAIPLFRFWRGRANSLVITNQAHSGWPAILAGRLWNSKVVARCGMVFGESAETLGLSGRKVERKKSLEKYTFQNADHCVVPSEHLAGWIRRHYLIESSKINVIPNYVDTRLFKPKRTLHKSTDVLYVGRLSEVKRPQLILESALNRSWRIRIIGNGNLLLNLQQFAEANRIDLDLIQRVPNEKLADFYNDSKVFALMSSWEGHPKTLIEAMSCGCACVCCKSPGIANLIKDGETGILVNPSAKDISKAIQTLINNSELRSCIGEYARKYAINHFSLDRVYRRYDQLLEELLLNEHE